MQQLLHDTYGAFFEEALLNEIQEVGHLKEVPANGKLMDIGSYIKGMPLLLTGAIKVLREDEEGNELLLYYLEQGETCSMTLTCCMGHTKSEIRAIAETDTQLVMVPVQKMDEWTAKYTSWRNFVFNSYQNRFNELLATLDGIAFHRLDMRLVNYLKEKARITENQRINNTHQEIAYELHSSRVVISRLLKKLEQMGKISLHRNYIELHTL
ncbi:Crp/Fnr family transcriptional regulator [Maribacter sp. 2307ULW6-5]|uniref:Crp/Fnr family transcriptional regulator n=1 Tax=Maribacter sp. 2307ULW6-5 TaxID=3386275 RepID=UPI0039BCDDA0